MATLPQVQTEDAFAEVRRDEAALRPGVERLGRRLGLDETGLSRLACPARAA